MIPFSKLVEEIEARPDGAIAESQKLAARLRFPEFSMVSVRDLRVPGPHGEVPIRHYSAGEDASPGLVWVHGGAYVFGDLDMPEANWVALSVAAAGIPVVSVEYRKAIHGIKFPVPADDVMAAWRWVTDHALELGFDPAHVHLGGASAGAHLSAEVAVRIRDEAAHSPKSLLLVYGPFHPVLPYDAAVLERTRALSDSEADRVKQYEEIHTHYAGPSNTSNDRAFPALGSVAGFPPAYFLNSDIDELRASAQAFAASIALAGGCVFSEIEPESQHGHLNEPDSEVGRRSVNRLIDWIRFRSAVDNSGSLSPRSGPI